MRWKIKIIFSLLVLFTITHFNLASDIILPEFSGGEQGRGFAVVADEVRKLAERTTKATKEIANMIQQIQNDTSEAVSSMKVGTNDVNSGKEMALKAGLVLEEIIESASKVSDVAFQVAAGSKEQSTSAEQISKNIDSITNITKQSAAGAQQIARSSGDLLTLTNKLKELISRFNIGEISSSYTVRDNGYIFHN